MGFHTIHFVNWNQSTFVSSHNFDLNVQAIDLSGFLTQEVVNLKFEEDKLIKSIFTIKHLFQ